MLFLVVTIVLAVLSVATFPCWSYSAHWGYTPSVIAGALLLCIAMVVVSNKYSLKAAEPEIAMATIARPYGAYTPYGRTVDALILAPDNTSQ